MNHATSTTDTTTTTDDTSKTPTRVTFEDLRYSVPLSGGNSGSNICWPGQRRSRDDDEFTILHGLTGGFAAGRLSALLGKSGSGKTTLLDLLAGRKTTGTTRNGKSDIRYDGRIATTSDFRTVVGYVEQFDTLVGELTVERMLQYTAALKLPRHATATERQRRVRRVIDRLDLHSCRHSVIGNALRRGISGGQAKRVNIGLALIHRPPILLLDEPTSGLDSQTAASVVRLLRQLAHERDDDGDDVDNASNDDDDHHHHNDRKRTVVCTLHAPSGHAFDLVDHLYMIQEGRCIYQGPRSAVQAYFERIIGSPRDPVASLPEWLVEITHHHSTATTTMTKPNKTKTTTPDDKDNDDHHHDDNNNNDDDDDKEDSSSAVDFVAAYQASALKRRIEQQQRAERLQGESSSILSTSKHTTVNKSGAAVPRADQRPPTELSRLWTLLKYRSLAHYADPEFVVPRFGDKVLFSLLFMSLYWDMGNDVDPRSVQSIASLFFFIAAKCGFGAASFVPALTLERTLYYRELADGCYAPITYYMAKFLEEAIIALFTSLVFTVVVYWGCNLQASFGIFFLAYYLTTLVGVILAYAFASFFTSMYVCLYTENACILERVCTVMCTVMCCCRRRRLSPLYRLLPCPYFVCVHRSAANSWLPTYVTVNLYFSGFVILFEKIPPGWQWFGWTSFMRYSWAAMMVDNFGDSAPGAAAVFFDADGNPQTVLEFYGMVEGPILNNAGACLGLLMTILVVFSVLGVLALAYIRHDKR